MCRQAEEEINSGLSPFSRVLLGLVSGLLGAMVIFIAPDTDKRIYFYIFGGFCLVITLACTFKGRIRQFMGSIIGCCLALLSIGYLGSEFIGDEPLMSKRSEQSLYNAVMFSVFFGIPGLSYALKAKFGFKK